MSPNGQVTRHGGNVELAADGTAAVAGEARPANNSHASAERKKDLMAYLRSGRARSPIVQLQRFPGAALRGIHDADAAVRVVVGEGALVRRVHGAAAAVEVGGGVGDPQLE